MTPGKGGLVCSEDTLGAVFPLHCVPTRWLVCSDDSDDIIGRGVFQEENVFLEMMMSKGAFWCQGWRHKGETCLCTDITGRKLCL